MEVVKRTEVGTLRDRGKREDSPDVNDDIDGVGQQFQGEFCLQEGVNLLYMIRDVFTDVLGEQGGTGLNAERQRTNWEERRAAKAEGEGLRRCVSRFKCESVSCGTKGEKLRLIQTRQTRRAQAKIRRPLETRRCSPPRSGVSQAPLAPESPLGAMATGPINTTPRRAAVTWIKTTHGM